MVARVLNVMGQLQDVGIVIECVRLVILGVSVKAIVVIPITVKRVQDVNHSDDNATDATDDARTSS